MPGARWSGGRIAFRARPVSAERVEFDRNGFGPHLRNRPKGRHALSRTRLGQILDVLERVRALRAASLAILYAGILAASLWLAYQLRFDFDVPARFSANALVIFASVLAIKLIFLTWFRQFDALLSY